MKQRLHIARGLLPDPPVMFLDEPTIGLDPVGARELRATIAALGKAGETILVTTTAVEADRSATGSRSSTAAINAQGAPGAPEEPRAAGSVVEVEVFGVAEERSPA